MLDGVVHVQVKHVSSAEVHRAVPNFLNSLLENIAVHETIEHFFERVCVRHVIKEHGVKVLVNQRSKVFGTSPIGSGVVAALARIADVEEIWYDGHYLQSKSDAV